MRISGRWRYASGSALLRLGVRRSGRELRNGTRRAGPHRLACAASSRRKTTRIEDTWYHVRSARHRQQRYRHRRRLRTEVSHPAHGTTTSRASARDKPSITAPLYRLPFGQVFGGGVAYGADRRAARYAERVLHVRASARARRRPHDRRGSRTSQLAIAEADNALDELATIAQRNVRSLTAYAERGELPPAGGAAARTNFRWRSSCERCRALAARIVQAPAPPGRDATPLRPHLSGPHHGAPTHHQPNRNARPPLGRPAPRHPRPSRPHAISVRNAGLPRA